MPARGWHHDRRAHPQPREVSSSEAPATMEIGKATAMVRILSEVSDALESSANGLRYLAHGGTPAPAATPSESTDEQGPGETQTPQSAGAASGAKDRRARGPVR
jgi:hypothetical protein